MLEFVLGYTTGQRSASRAASLARSAAAADGTIHANQIEDVNERLDKLALIIRALWALLEEQGMTADQLVAKIEEVDMRDGKLDGQVRQQPTDCRSCQSKVAPGLATCQFCGARVRFDGGHPLSDM